MKQPVHMIYVLWYYFQKISTSFPMEKPYIILCVSR